jgi:hypothetical protein
MNAPNDNTAPLRSGMRRIFPPWEYRHLRAWAAARIAAGTGMVGLGAVTLVEGSFTTEAIGWAAIFFFGAALALVAGYWELTIARSAPPRT